MSNLEVKDYKGRVARLLKDRGYMVAGSRYVTRKSAAKVIRGESHKVWGGSEFTKPGVWRWYAESDGETFLRLGCHIFRNENFRTIKEWALAR